MNMQVRTYHTAILYKGKIPTGMRRYRHKDIPIGGLPVMSILPVAPLFGTQHYKTNNNSLVISHLVIMPLRTSRTIKIQILLQN